MKSPTARTLARCKELGWIAERTEHWAHGRRHDLFGFADIICLRRNGLLVRMPHVSGPVAGIVAIQATTGSSKTARLEKIINEKRDNAIEWLTCGGIIEVWSWYRYADTIDARWWRETITPVTLEML